MFTGAVYFKKTEHGYVIDDWIELVVNEFNVLAWPAVKLLRLQGQFNFNPVRGQFCKRPHKLIQWTKND